MSDRLKMILVMVIWGSVGLFVKEVSLPSGQLAMMRGLIGAIFLFIICKLGRYPFSKEGIRKNFPLLFLSGAAIGINWIFMFASYRYTSVSLATISYYFSPVIVTILSPFVLKEKLSGRQMGFVLLAMVGLVLTSWKEIMAFSMGNNDAKGILLALSAACFYAAVVLITKFIRNLGGVEVAIVQLFSAAVILIPYILLAEPFSLAEGISGNWMPVLTLGILHTGIAYYLYFDSIAGLRGQTVAILSYVNLLVAIFLSALFLREQLTAVQWIGGVLIFGTTLLSSLLEEREKVTVLNKEPGKNAVLIEE